MGVGETISGSYFFFFFLGGKLFYCQRRRNQNQHRDVCLTRFPNYCCTAVAVFRDKFFSFNIAFQSDTVLSNQIQAIQIGYNNEANTQSRYLDFITTPIRYRQFN